MVAGVMKLGEGYATKKSSGLIASLEKKTQEPLGLGLAKKDSPQTTGENSLDIDLVMRDPTRKMYLNLCVLRDYLPIIGRDRIMDLLDKGRDYYDQKFKDDML